MITEDYVSFEVAKLLKEKGFDESIRCWYDNFQDFHEEGARMCNTDCLPPTIMCPTLQMAMKWLREVHHWHIFVIPKWEDIEYMPGEWEEKMVGYQYVIINVGEITRKNEQPTTTALSPESACEKGIKYCLEHLI